MGKVRGRMIWFLAGEAIKVPLKPNWKARHAEDSNAQNTLCAHCRSTSLNRQPCYVAPAQIVPALSRPAPWRKRQRKRLEGSVYHPTSNRRLPAAGATGRATGGATGTDFGCPRTPAGGRHQLLGVPSVLVARRGPSQGSIDPPSSTCPQASSLGSRSGRAATSTPRTVDPWTATPKGRPQMPSHVGTGAECPSSLHPSAGTNLCVQRPPARTLARNSSWQRPLTTPSKSTGASRRNHLSVGEFSTPVGGRPHLGSRDAGAEMQDS